MAQEVVVVTGAGTGIGRAISLAFAARGASVVAVGRNTANLGRTGALVRDAGGECLVHPADIADSRMAANAIEVADQHFGCIDVLVNNAAQGVCAPIEELDLAEFNTMLAVNAAAVVYTCRAVWPVMKRRQGGTIINISSAAAVDPYPGLTPYGATKAFVNLLTKGLAEEGKPHKIAVFAVGPGAVETDMLRRAFPDFPAEQTLPPSAVADVVVALTDPCNRYCSGQTIYVRK